MRILTYITTEEDAGRAARSVVPRRFQLGTHAFRRLKVEGGILCDGAPLRADTVLRAGQRLEIRMDNGETETKAEIKAALDGLPPSFIRYIDEDMLVVSKGAPLATLPCGHIHTGTLREQLAALLYRYALAKGYEADAGSQAALSAYGDAGEVSGYALPAMRWACDAGIVTGVTESALEPRGTATRAQAATMFMRFLNLMSGGEEN